MRAEKILAGISGAETLREFRRNKAALGEVIAASEKTRKISVNIFDQMTRLFGRFNFAEWVGLTAILLVGFTLVSFDLATAGAATAATLFFHRLFNPIAAFLFTFDEIQASGASLTRLVGVLETQTTHREPKKPAMGTVLAMRDLRYSYDEHTEVLRGIDLDIAAGKKVALVGATGAGKSTLAAIVAGAIDTAEGELAVTNDRLLITQEVHVFACTVRENLSLAKPDASESALQAALEQVHAWTWVNALPDGLDTRVGHLGVPLSAAQAQQLALARIALRTPALTILDEATAEAGSSGARSLDLAAQNVTEGLATLVVAHRLSQAKHADVILVMDQGAIVERGSHEELLARDGRYAQLWQAWQ